MRLIGEVLRPAPRPKAYRHQAPIAGVERQRDDRRREERPVHPLPAEHRAPGLVHPVRGGLPQKQSERKGDRDLLGE